MSRTIRPLARLGLALTIGGLVAVVAVAVVAGCGGNIPRTIVEYQDFVHLGGRNYYNQAAQASGCSDPGGPQVSSRDLGPVVATVGFDLAMSGNPNRQVADRDSGQLPKGTKIYAVRGFRPEFRLAAYNHGHLALYDVTDYPAASSGRDLIDINAAQVATIAISAADHDPSPSRGTIGDVAQVTQMVAMIINAPVGIQTVRAVGDRRFCLTFQLRDGLPWISRPYFPASGLLGLAQSLDMPPAFRDAINAATHQ